MINLDLSSQRRMAAEILDVGESRVWLDPNEAEEISNAITREDVRNLIDEGLVEKKPEKGVSRGRARKKQNQKSKGRQSGHGSRKGKKGARKNSKEKWKENIRSIRDYLRDLRDNGDIETSKYRDLYNMASGGRFESKRQLKNYLESRGILGD